MSFPSFEEVKPATVESKTERVLGQSFEKLVEEFTKITEFKEKELKSISLLMTNKYFAKLLKFYVANKKHLKRRHAREILKLSEEVAKAISSTKEPAGEASLMDRLLKR